MTADPSVQPDRADLFANLPEDDRLRMGAALRHLLAHGSIFGQDPADKDIYRWCRQNREQLQTLCDLLEFRLRWDDELQFVQAIPPRAEFLRRLPLDWTLVILALWHEFDVALRERGEAPPVRISIEQLNEQLRCHFSNLYRPLPPRTTMRDILRFAHQKRLIRFESLAVFQQSTIDILPTIKHVIPFQDIDQWRATVERLMTAPPDEDSAAQQEQGHTSEEEP